ncbi:MAG: hypothetical protein AB8G05_14870 [Oligoflexales bacterium]
MLMGVLLVLAGFRQVKVRAEKKLVCLESMLEEIKSLQFLLLSDPCQAFSAKIGRRDDISLVLNSVKSMYFEGAAPLASIQAIVQVLLNVRVWLSKKLQIECLIIGRFLLVICVVSMIRFALGFPFSFSNIEIQGLIFDLDMVLGRVDSSKLLTKF